MRTANDRASEGRSPETTVPSQGEQDGRGEGKAWTAPWNVVNTPVVILVSVVAALGVFLAIFLGQLNRMEDRLETQIGQVKEDILREVKEDIVELRDSNQATKELLLVLMGELEERLLAQIGEMEESMLAREERLLAQINRGTEEIGEQ